MKRKTNSGSETYKNEKYAKTILLYIIFISHSVHGRIDVDDDYDDDDDDDDGDDDGDDGDDDDDDGGDDNGVVYCAVQIAILF